MKKLIALLLALLTCLFIAACGGKEENPTETQAPVAETPTQAPEQEPVEEATVPESFVFTDGEYRTFGGFEATYQFHDDGTFAVESPDRPDYEMTGTYTVAENQNLDLEDSEGGHAYFAAAGKYLFKIREHDDNSFCCFKKDNQYGQPITLDENGRSNQTFVAGLAYRKTGCRHTFALVLREDGTCDVNYFVTEDRGAGDKIVEQMYTGTYQVEGDLLLVSYNGIQHPMLINNGMIYFWALEKI